MKTKWLLPLALLCGVLGGGIIGCESSDDKEEDEAKSMTLTFTDNVAKTDPKEFELEKNGTVYKFKDNETYPLPNEEAGKSFAGWYLGDTLYEDSDFTNGFSYNKDGYTLTAKYNDIITENYKAGNAFVFNTSKPETAPIVVDMEYLYADYTKMHVCGIELAFGKEFCTGEDTNNDNKEDTVQNDTHLVLGIYAGSDLAWWYTDSFITQNNTDANDTPGTTTPDVKELLKATDKTGLKNDELAREIFGDTLEAFDWAKNYGTTYSDDLPEVFSSDKEENTGVTWYIPSVIEFRKYIEKNISSYLELMNTLGGITVKSGIDFWTASLDVIGDEYSPCFYSTQLESYPTHKPAFKKYALAICQYTPSATSDDDTAGSGGNGNGD